MNLRRQSQVSAQLAYNPKIRGLRALLAELQATRDTEVSAAHSQRVGSVQAIKQARPQIMGAYDRQSDSLDANRAAVAMPMAQNLGPAATSILQAAQSEHGLAQNRVADARRRESVDLTNQRKSAAAGEGYATQAANQRYAADSAKLLDQLVGVLGDQGLYASKVYGDLLGDKADRGLKRRQQNITKRGQDLAHQDRQDSINARGKGRTTTANGGRGWVSDSIQARARSTVSEALAEIPSLRDSGASRDEAMELLSKGVKETRSPVYVTDDRGKQIRKLKPDGTPEEKVVHGIPQIKDQLLLRAAIEQAYDGFISRETQRMLHKNRIKVGPLGVTPFNKRKVGINPFSPNRESSGPPY